MTKNDSTDSELKNDPQTIDAPSYFESQNDEFGRLIAEHIALPYTLAQYQLVEEIGRGGMGIVFKAQDASQNLYAIKILKNQAFGTAEERQRFRKEAILHSQIQSDFVVKLIEFSSVQKIDYIVSEYVSGSNLQVLLREVFKLGPDAALKIIRDVLHGLKDIHDKQILHRDIKPGNIIVSLDPSTPQSRLSTNNIRKACLVDLGLARQVLQSESLAMTKTMATMGTPLYMAPEQNISDKTIGASADVYSVGCTLYHLLAGEPPFDARVSAEIADMHRLEKPQNLTRINPRVNHVVNEIVQRALHKNPADRYQSGSEMLADVEAVLSQEPIAFVPFPLTPGNKYKTYTFTKTFSCTPQQLWPFVAETDRFNRAVGLPPPEFIFEGSGESRKRIAKTQFNGLKISWTEHAFEWIVNQRMSVLREFESGPFKWVTNTVFLESLSHQRTRLIHEFQVEARGLLGKLLTPIQFGFATPRDLKRVYTEIEELVGRNDHYACDASLTPKKGPMSVAMDKLTIAKNELIALGHDKNMVADLSKYLCQSSDTAVSRIRPYALAGQLTLSKFGLLALCIDGTASNLLQLYWDIICPVCRLAANTVNSIKDLESHAFCEVCENQFDVDFSNSVEGVFSVHPEIRSVDRRTYCVGGPFHSPHVVAQIKVPKKQSEIENIPFETGPYAVRCHQIADTPQIESDEDSSYQVLNLQLPDEGTEIKQVSTGEVQCKIDNNSVQDMLIRIERSTERSDVLTVFELMENPRFQKNFGSELDSIEDLIHPIFGLLVAIRIDNFAELVDSMGESRASRVWNDLVLELDRSSLGCAVVSKNFNQLVLACDNNQTPVSVILNIIAVYMQGKIAFSLCATKDNFQMSGNSNSRRFFGEAIRSVTEICDALDVGQLSLHQSLFDESLNQWIKNNVDEPRTNCNALGYFVLTLS